MLIDLHKRLDYYVGTSVNYQQLLQPVSILNDLLFEPGAVFHRIGGGSLDNLRLKPAETHLTPPGFSVLTGVTPQEAAKQIRDAFPSAITLHEAAETIGSATREEIRAIGFEVIPDPTKKFPNHARVIHPQGLAGFTDEKLEKLSKAFTETTRC